MIDLRLATIADLPEMCAYVAARYHASLTYDCPTWRILAPSGRIHEGFSLAEAVTWYELREPEHVPDACSYCQQEFSFDRPWIIDTGSFFHERCLGEAFAEVERCRRADEYSAYG